MFPWFREIVTGVPAHERCLHLDESERSICRLAEEHPEIEAWSPGALRALLATRDRYRPVRALPSGSRAAR